MATHFDTPESGALDPPLLQCSIEGVNLLGICRSENCGTAAYMSDEETDSESDGFIILDGGYVTQVLILARGGGGGEAV